MPPQNTHEIFQRELDLFEKEVGGGLTSNPAYKEQVKSFLLQSLQRASLAVVEASVGEEITLDSESVKNATYGSKNELSFSEKGFNMHRSYTLATAKKITGE